MRFLNNTFTTTTNNNNNLLDFLNQVNIANTVNNQSNKPILNSNIDGIFADHGGNVFSLIQSYNANVGGNVFLINSANNCSNVHNTNVSSIIKNNTNNNNSNTANDRTTFHNVIPNVSNLNVTKTRQNLITSVNQNMTPNLNCNPFVLFQNLNKLNNNTGSINVSSKIKYKAAEMNVIGNVQQDRDSSKNSENSTNSNSGNDVCGNMNMNMNMNLNMNMNVNSNSNSMNKMRNVNYNKNCNVGNLKDVVANGFNECYCIDVSPLFSSYLQGLEYSTVLWIGNLMKQEEQIILTLNISLLKCISILRKYFDGNNSIMEQNIRNMYSNYKNKIENKYRLYIATIIYNYNIISLKFRVCYFQMKNYSSKLYSTTLSIPMVVPLSEQLVSLHNTNTNRNTNTNIETNNRTSCNRRSNIIYKNENIGRKRKQCSAGQMRQMAGISGICGVSGVCGTTGLTCVASPRATQVVVCMDRDGFENTCTHNKHENGKEEKEEKENDELSPVPLINIGSNSSTRSNTTSISSNTSTKSTSRPGLSVSISTRSKSNASDIENENSNGISRTSIHTVSKTTRSLSNCKVEKSMSMLTNVDRVKSAGRNDCQLNKGKRNGYGYGYKGLDGLQLKLNNITKKVESRNSNDKLKPFKCDFAGCNKRFSQKGTLKKHRYIHTGERPFKCTIKGCNKGFIQKSDLSNHITSHFNIRNFQCKVDGCKKKFKTKAQLVKHGTVHSNAKPYKCNYNNCQKEFKRKASLNQHIKQKHNLVA